MKRFIKNRFLRILTRVIIGLLIFFSLVVLFIRSPWGQNIIVTKAVSFIADKTGTEVSIDRLYLTFSGNLYLEGLYLEDEQQDTLVYSKDLEVSVALLPLIKGDKINVKSVDWDGLKANIHRPASSENFNYNFLIEAFASTDTTTANTSPTASPEIVIGKISFSNFDITYNDEPLGMKASAVLGALDLEIDALDIEQMIYEIDELSIADSKIQYELSKALEASTNQTHNTQNEASILPTLSVEALKLKNVSLDYNAIPDRTEAKINIGNFRLELPTANLQEQKIVLDELTLNDSKIFIKQLSNSGQTTPTDSSSISEPMAFEWPKWSVVANNISFSENDITFQTTDSLPQSGVFDSNWIEIKKLNFKADDIEYEVGKASLVVDQFSFTERSGLTLKEFEFDLELTDKLLSIESLDFATAQNMLSGDLSLKYASLTELINSPELSLININLDELKINLLEAKSFSPELAQNEYVQSLSKKNLTGRLVVDGNLNDLQIEEAVVNWGKETNVEIAGRVTNPTDVDRIELNLSTINAKTTRTDLSQIIDTTGLGLGLPENVALTGAFKGGLNDAQANLKLNTTSGNVEVKGQFSQNESISFDGLISVKELQLNQLLQNEQLDTLTFTVDLKGIGTGINDLTAELKTNFERLKYNGYDFSNLKLNGKLDQGNGNIDLSFKDENLDMTMQTKLELDSVAPKVITNLTVKGADFGALGLVQENIKTAFVLDASFEGNESNFDLTTELNDGVAIYKQKAYTFGSFNLVANSASDTLSIDINSQTIDARVVANKGLADIAPVLQKEFTRYLNNGATLAAPDSLSDDTKLKITMVARPTQILSEVFLQGLERMDSIAFEFDFDAKANKLSAELMAPYINFQGTEIDSLGFKVNGKNDQLDFLLGWSGVNSGPVSIDKTKLEGKVDAGVVTSRFNVINNRETLLNIKSEVKLRGDTMELHIVPDTLIFNSQEWKILDQNQIALGSNYINVNNFELSRGSQKITLGTSLPGQEQDHLGAVFNNFQLTTLTSLLNAEKPLASGVLKGNIIMENPLGSFGVVAGLNISDLTILEVPFGQLNLEAQSTGAEKYQAELSLKGADADLDLSGDYAASANGGDLNLTLNLNELKMSAIEQFSNNSISESKGSISAKVEVSGNTNDPQYSGTLSFSQVGFLVNELNARFAIANEQLKVDNSGLYLDNFVITDGESNDFSLEGKILTESLNNPSFDLKVKANNFRVVNSAKEDSDLFYGQLNVGADLTITGDLNIPKVRGSLKVIDGSTLTFTVPESQLELKERDGVVLFVNRENPDDILTKGDQSEVSADAAAIAGYDIETIITIGDNSEFNIIIDESTGDNLRVVGDGDFNLSIEPNGRIGLSGKYELSGGHYEANLFNLVKRRFEIAPGSTISWSGDPYDADLDVSAIYSIKTSASPLMATRTSAEATGLETSYQQRLPFQVYINVDGELLSPSIAFNLDMPEDERGSLSGTVYSQVQQLNSQEEELNKQVFSLLVLNRFFPSSGSDGSSGGPTSLALDNVNNVLSGQLNNYSEKIFGNTGIDVGFNLNSNTTDANSGQVQTQLGITAKKEFFNDRLIVSVGSEVDVAGNQNASQGAPIIGNVSLEYLLTEDKRLRLQGFSRNEYEGVIDGQLTISGIALVFTREFNKFKELFAKQVKEEVEKKEKENNKK
ncbi:translocation/assembly module TamB domain-containing protein [uncultured Roseivirga sp.]|uniref:translocation/assembly module TamB domain-containing protein n=1 Tax=uncultured Roseivirga sp. TaxID=543088 RepID=UPI0030D904DB